MKTISKLSPPSSFLPSSPKSNSSKKKRRAKIVSFTEEVLSKDHVGDGNNVVVKEEHGVFLGPMLGRVTISSDNNNNNSQQTNDNSSDPALSVVSFGIAPSSSSSSSDCGGAQSHQRGSSESGENLEFDNLVVRMGLLKCGHRYQLVIPVPNYWRNQQQRSSSAAAEFFTVRTIEHSLDADLKGEIEKEECTKPAKSDDCSHADDDNDLSSSHTSQQQYFLKITLSASRRGPYRGRFALELTSCCYHNDSPEQHRRVGADDDDDGDSARFASAAIRETTENEVPRPSIKKCIMSVQVDATIMGTDMGTPKLRNGVVCLGKMVGYDSDDDTEWQGFD